jgi:hypothetical protein
LPNNHSGIADPLSWQIAAGFFPPSGFLFLPIRVHLGKLINFGVLSNVSRCTDMGPIAREVRDFFDFVS